jgi:hypothetical protein
MTNRVTLLNFDVLPDDAYKQVGLDANILIHKISDKEVILGNQKVVGNRHSNLFDIQLLTCYPMQFENTIRDDESVVFKWGRGRHEMAPINTIIAKTDMLIVGDTFFKSVIGDVNSQLQDLILQMDTYAKYLKTCRSQNPIPKPLNILTMEIILRCMQKKIPVMGYGIGGVFVLNAKGFRTYETYLDPATYSDEIPLIVDRRFKILKRIYNEPSNNVVKFSLSIFRYPRTTYHHYRTIDPQWDPQILTAVAHSSKSFTPHVFKMHNIHIYALLCPLHENMGNIVLHNFLSINLLKDTDMIGNIRAPPTRRPSRPMTMTRTRTRTTRRTNSA